MKFFYALSIGLAAVGFGCIPYMLFFPEADPPLVLGLLLFLFLIGIISGWFEADRKQRKKEEEEERQAEQERTNELMREYLERKLREEEDK